MEIDKSDDRAKSPEEIEREEWERQKVKQRFKKVMTIASPVCILLLWELLSRTELIDSRFFPPPTAIVATFFNMIQTGTLFEHLSISLIRIVGGFLLGVIPGIIIGLLMGMYAPFRHFFQPLIMALMPIPTLALLPIIIIIFGSGETSKLVTIAGSVFFQSSLIQPPVS